MSKPDATAAPIPVGILVHPPAPRAKVEKPAPMLTPPARPNPWLWVVTAGSVIYAALILAIGLSLTRPEPPAVVELATPIPPIQVAATPAPIPEPMTEPEPTPSEPPVRLPTVLVRVIDPPPPEEVVVPEPVRPIVPAAKPKSMWNQVDTSVYASCEQIGANVLFVKNPVEAFRMAKDEKKLVFMVHLSGNLEDKEFT